MSSSSNNIGLPTRKSSQRPRWCPSSIEIGPVTWYFSPIKDTLAQQVNDNLNLDKLSSRLKKMLSTSPKNASKSKIALLKKHLSLQMETKMPNGENA
jgi:hypothetical protein